MFYTFCIIMIAIASILLILAVLVQSPKSGMAANFGAANQTMGVRQTTDFLEKFTWAMIAAVVFFTLLSVVAMSTGETETKDNYEGYFDQSQTPTDEAADLDFTNVANPEEGDTAEVTTEETATEDTEE